jgi:hypothetical protein
MKILANQPSLVKRTDANLPFGSTIQDETETQSGTPIVADLMQDIFSNLYRLLEITGTTPTDDFDSDLTEYQIIDALKKLPNDLNDSEKVLTLSGTVWSVPLKLSLLPNEYFFFARATDDYVAGTTYTFKGTEVASYSFTSDPFITGTQLLIVIDTGGVRAYPIARKQTLVYEAICGQIGTNDPKVEVVFKSENKLLTSLVRKSIGYYEAVLSSYTNVFVEVIPIGALADDNMNYPTMNYGTSEVSFNFGTGKDCDRVKAFYIRITQKV